MDLSFASSKFARGSEREKARRSWRLENSLCCDTGAGFIKKTDSLQYRSQHHDSSTLVEKKVPRTKEET